MHRVTVLSQALEVDQLEGEQRAEDDNVGRLEVDEHEAARVDEVDREAQALENVLALDRLQLPLSEKLGEGATAALEHHG